MTPKDLVELQLTAYNNQDLDLFCSYYAPNVNILSSSGRNPIHGREALKEMFGRLFSDIPTNRVSILNRIEQGDFVIDQEWVTGRPGDPYSVVAVYEVKNNLIQNVWFYR